MAELNPLSPEQYYELELPILPCMPGEKKPKHNNWQDGTTRPFFPGDNIGCRLVGFGDFDIDNEIAKKFEKFIKAKTAVYGRKSNPRSHMLFRLPTNPGVEYKAKKFVLPTDFNKYTTGFAHGNCLVEFRTGPGYQTIVPGSKIKGEDVEWEVFKGIQIYPGDLVKDIGLVALLTALSIIFPPKGARDHFLFCIACLLVRTKQFNEDEINDIVYELAKANLTIDECKGQDKKGTKAFKALNGNKRMMGFTKLKEFTGIGYSGLFEIFSWVNLEQPNEKLYELINKYYYLEDTGLMYDPITGKEFPETIFNNNNLYDFPGAKGKDKAFKSLLKHFEFQDRILLSKQFLPSHTYPIATVTASGEDSHNLLPQGKYFNLWNGFKSEPMPPRVVEDDETGQKIDVRELIQLFNNHYIKILGEKAWDVIKQYISMCLKYPGQKHRWVPLIISPEGVGKGLLLRAISRMMGAQYVNENVSFADITEKHSTIVVGTLFVALNEVSIDGGQYTTKRTISAKIKPFLSDDFLNINEKGKPIYKYLNNCNAMIFSNDENCLHIDTSSRRYYVCVSKITDKEIRKITDDEVFSQLFMLVDRFSDELMFHFLEEVEIEDVKIYSKRAPRTPDLLNMIEDSKHDLIAELDDALKYKTAPFDDGFFRGVISLNQLMHFIKTEWNIPHPPRKLVKNWLNEKGHEWEPGKKTRQVMMKDSRPRVHWLDKEGYRSKLNELTEGELGALMDEPWPADYLEFQKLDYKMIKKEKRNIHPEHMEKYALADNLKRAIPHLVKLPFSVIEDIFDILNKNNAWYKNASEREKMKLSPMENEHNVFIKVCKYLDQLVKKYEKTKF